MEIVRRIQICINEDSPNQESHTKIHDEAIAESIIYRWECQDEYRGTT